MKVKRYYAMEYDEHGYIAAHKSVDATDYDALLLLARRLRRMLFVAPQTTPAARVVLDDSAWLEE